MTGEPKRRIGRVLNQKFLPTAELPWMLSHMDEISHLAQVLASGVDEHWLSELAKCGTLPMVRCAIACIDESLACLDTSTIILNSRPIRRVVMEWVTCPCVNHARQAYEFIRNAEELAANADAESLEPGDWWSYEAVEEVGFLLTAIAQYHDLAPHSQDFPDPPEHLAKQVCEYFLAFPYNRRRNKLETLQRISDEALSPLMNDLRDRTNPKR